MATHQGARRERADGPADRARHAPRRARQPRPPAPTGEPAGAPAPGGPAANARWQAINLSALNVLAGVWLVISPSFLDYRAGDSAWNPVVCGVLVAVLALVRAAGAVRVDAAAVANMAVGTWLFASGFWLADSGQARWNAFIFGAFVFVLAAMSLNAGRASTDLPGASRAR